MLQASLVAHAIALAFVAPLPAHPACAVARATTPSMGLLKTLRDTTVAPSIPASKPRSSWRLPAFAERLSALKAWRPRSWRTKAAVQDALLTAGVRRGLATRLHRKNRDLAEVGWEESLLPPVLHAAASVRDLAEDGWEERLLPSIELAAAPRRNLAENSWEDRLLPRPIRLRPVTATRDLSEDSWEEHLVPNGAAAAASTFASSSLDGWEARLLPGL